MGAELSSQSMQCLPYVAADVLGETPTMKLFGQPPKLMGAGKNTVLVFDWDDTLLCSSACRVQRWTVEELEALEAAVTSILRTAMGLGELLIVTNGNATWVEESASRFLPGLMPLLAEVQVVSARALYEHRYPGDPFMWKRAAFEQLLTKERHFPADTGMHLIALGDQAPEIDAAQHVSALIGGPSLVKTVKFREQPSVADLLGQLHAVEQALPGIVKGQASQSYEMARNLPLLFRPFASDTSGWTCVAEREHPSDPSLKEIVGMGPTVGLKEIVGLFTH